MRLFVREGGDVRCAVGIEWRPIHHLGGCFRTVNPFGSSLEYSVVCAERGSQL
jgi:hypothetical protein